MARSIDGLIWVLGGAVLETAGARYRTMKYICENYFGQQWPYGDQEEFLAQTDGNARRILSRLHGRAKNGERDHKLVFERNLLVGLQLYQQMMDGEETPPVPGITSVLSEVKLRGLRQVAVSNGPSELVRAKVRRYGLSNWFDAVIAHPQGFQEDTKGLFAEAVSGLGIGCERVALISDRVSDVCPAREVGVGRVYLVAYGLDRNISAMTTVLSQKVRISGLAERVDELEHLLRSECGIPLSE